MFLLAGFLEFCADSSFFVGAFSIEPIPTVVVQDIRSYPGKVVWPALDICFWEVLDGEGIQGKGEWVLRGICS